MCGICGLVYNNPSRNVKDEQILNMCETIRHRGPDDGGTYVKGSVGLGFRRLAIIDLSPTGHQPMCNEDGSIWIAFNGEIYNYLELREYLISKGHTFRSRSDTETIIHLWEEEGEQCVEKLRGMFAIAIWDSNRGSLFLARDREGKKPLFYAALHDKFLFGSEIKAILADPDFNAEPDMQAIHHYLAYQSVPAPFCAFKGVNKLPPAHTLLWKDGRITLRRYWKLSYANKRIIRTPQDEQTLQEEIIERLREAVRIRLMSEVPLGAFLSGGIDSSIVVALMAGLMNQPVKTFSIGFTNEEYNELPYARMVADRYGTEHHEFIVTPDAKTIFPELVWHYNEPFADSSAIPTYYVSKLAREHVTVILTGDAGDENFAGYPRYQFDGDYQLSNKLSYALNRFDRRNPLTGNYFNPDDPFGTIKRLAGLSQERLLYYLRITHFHEGYQKNLYTPEFRKILGNKFTVDWMLDIYRDSDAKNFLDSTLDLDLRLYLPDTLMTKVDIASMTHSLEARAPMLDHKFLEFTATIPSRLKLNNEKVAKYIFKKAVEPYLPHDVIYRKKMGFGVPIDHWFRNELKEMTYDILLSRKAIERGYFKSSYIQSMLERHQAGENWQYLIWNLLMLEMWHLMFIDREIEYPVGDVKKYAQETK